MIQQFAILVLYLAAICRMTRESPREERIEACVMILVTLLSERCFNCFDPSRTAHDLSHHHDNAFLEEFFSSNSNGTLYALMVVCFLGMSCLHNGGSIENFIVRKLDYGDDDDDDDDDTDDNNPYLTEEEYDDENNEKARIRIQQRRERRRNVLLQYFENSGCFKMTHASNEITPSNVAARQQQFSIDQYSTPGAFGAYATSCYDCRICLETFHATDRLVRSQDPACTHTFHRTCLVEFFARLGSKDVPSCPCCRRPFCGNIDIGNMDEINSSLECR